MPKIDKKIKNTEQLKNKFPEIFKVFIEAVVGQNGQITLPKCNKKTEKCNRDFNIMLPQSTQALYTSLLI